MGLLQRAVETYDANQALVGVYQEGKDPLAPIAHTLTSANLEVTLDRDGRFLSARKVDKSEPKILIPVTEESAGRTSAPAPHPLCEQLKYISPKREREHSLYLDLLRSWAKSPHSHPMLFPILAYAEGETVVADLISSGVLALNPKGDYDEKQLIRWVVNGIENEEPACWKNQNLLQAFVAYYSDRISDRAPGLCMAQGEMTIPAAQHPKGIIPINGNAKLISANDSSGFTYRGRFTDDTQAATVGFFASQKAHNALRWLASSQGVREFAGNRIFLCWNPRGFALPRPMRPGRAKDAPPKSKPSDYREDLRRSLFGLQQGEGLKGTETAVLASFDAATTGRLALTYYNEISLPLFLQRLWDWDTECCWYRGRFGIQAPSLFQIVNCAFGTQRGDGTERARLETDDKIQRQHLQRLLECKVSGGVFPVDIVQALCNRASTPQAYEPGIWREILFTACAAIQKYRYDTKQGGDEMSWELDKQDRSFQFGRLLAVMERAEEDYYSRTQEKRQTNAIKSLSEFKRRPWTVFERVNFQLEQAYLPRIPAAQATRYKKLSGEICRLLFQFTEAELDRPLTNLYLVGYELQRNAFFASNKERSEDLFENDSIEED